MKKLKKIILPEDYQEVQRPLFNPIRTTESYFPCKVHRGIDDFRRILSETQGEIGLDFEFPPSYIASIIGISNLSNCCAVLATPELVRDVVNTSRQKNIKLIGHSVVGAEMQVIKVTTGIEMKIEEMEDTMLSHFLLNQDLCKAPDKREDDDAGAMGFMNLWSAVSMVLDVPNTKQCRGASCDGEICPRHDVKGYCAIDSWDSIATWTEHQNLFKQHNLDPTIYNDLKEITYLAELMHQKGIKIDMEWVNKLEEKSDKYKEELFEYEVENNKKIYKRFNPRSNQQTVNWFKSKGVELKSTSKDDIRKSLEKTAEEYGYKLKDEEGCFSTDELGEIENLHETLDALYCLYEFKASGKGLAPWFSDKYRDRNNFIHPRFITVGASTTRWSSSKPNFQNIPVRGFGNLVRAAIIPRDSSLDLLKADFSQLELRTCLYLAGVDPDIIGEDAFTWLVEQAGGKFDDAASKAGADPRDFAKSTSHAGDYLEGFTLLKSNDVYSPGTKKSIEKGSLRVYLKKFGAPFDWEFGGKIVAFTGANLSERLFGDKSHANRKKALDIQEDIYFKQFPMLRVWQKKVLDEVQDKGFIRYPTGHFLRLYGTHLDNAKMATAALGQGVSAQHVQGIQLRFYREMGAVPIMAVHDELDFEISTQWSDKQAYDFIKLMGEETNRLPGFKVPFKTMRGKKWIEFKRKNPATHIEGAMKPLDIK